MSEEYSSSEKVVSQEVTRVDLLHALNEIPIKSWEGAGYPILTSAPKHLYYKENENQDVSNEFWKEIFNPRRFLLPNSSLRVDLKNDFIFILHSFNNEKGDDVKFKAVTTSVESFIEDPSNMIVYGIHGFPCENRGGGEYPTINDFWKDFYDKLSIEDQDRYPICDKLYRKNLIQNKMNKK